MEYLVIKQYSDGSCFIVEPNKPLTIVEAQALREMFARNDESHKYIIVQMMQ